MIALLASVLIASTPNAPQMISLTIRPEVTHQTIDNFGASDSWTVEPLIHWPEESRTEIADLLFDQEKGAGLSCWRFNIGGGIQNKTIDNPLRTVDTFEIGPGKYDWSKCPGQMWMLHAARDRGVDKVLVYTNTPPARLTRNGLTSATDKLGTYNLKLGKEGEFASYICDVTEHFLSENIPVKYISPVNEPDFEWNGGQEGSRVANRDIISVTSALEKEIKRRKLDVRQVAPEASSITSSLEVTKGITEKYGAKYGNYVDMFAQNPDWRKEVNPIFGYHSYWTDSFEQMLSIREILRDRLAAIPDTEVWQTEYCQMAGPRGEGGWGRDLGMTLALNTARLMQIDLSVVGVTAWQWWLGVSNGDYKDGLIYVDDLDKSDGPIYASKTLWAIGQFSRFVRPGYQRVDIEGPTMNLFGTQTSAYKSPDGSKLVVVIVNCGGSSQPFQLRASGFNQGVGYITSDKYEDNIRKTESYGLNKPVTVPPRTIMTLVCSK